MGAKRKTKKGRKSNPKGQDLEKIDEKKKKDIPISPSRNTMNPLSQSPEATPKQTKKSKRKRKQFSSLTAPSNNEEDSDTGLANRVSQITISTKKARSKNKRKRKAVVLRQLSYTSDMEFLTEYTHGGRYRFDGNQESNNQFTFIERRRYRKLVLKVKQMKLRRMLTVLGPQGFYF